MVDFEEEVDDSGSYTPFTPYDAERYVNPKKGKTFFGGDDDDDDYQDYNFQFETGTKGGYQPKSTTIAAFSPRPEGKQNQIQGRSNDISALDKAKEMLQKYSKPNSFGPTSMNEKASNKYKTGKASLSFEEEDFSVEMGEEEDAQEGYEGSLSLSSPGFNHTPVNKKISGSKAQEIQSAPMKHKEADKTVKIDSSPPFNLNTSRTNNKLQNNNTNSTSNKNQSSKYNRTMRDLEESVDEVEDEDEHNETEIVEDENEEGLEEEDGEYSDEEFDHDEGGEKEESYQEKQSNNYKYKNNLDDSESINEEASYSRMVYSQEEEEEGEEDEEESVESMEQSKPKILSFAGN
jgi:hypothetical protein